MGEEQHTLAERHDRRDRTDLQSARQFLLGLGVDLGVHHVGMLLGRAFKTGAKARQGPHQEAQKSTRTMGLSVTVDSKSVAVSSTVAMRGPFGSVNLLSVQYPTGYIYSLGFDTPAVWL